MILSINQTYPLPIANGGSEGASASFLLKSGSLLQIIINNLDDKELYSLKKGDILAGFLYESGEILWLFKFFGKDKKPAFTLDCPFDARLIPSDDIALHSITNAQQRLVIEIHVIDSGILKVLREVTMPPDLTIEFLSAVQNQLCAAKNTAAQQKWLQYSPDELFKICKKYRLGT